MTLSGIIAPDALAGAGDVHRVVLRNGLTVLVRRDTTAPVVAIVTYVKAGYFDETDDVIGIAHVLEHMFFKGTERRAVGAIAQETKASGGYLNAHTIYDHTSYYTVLPAASFERGLEIQADAYAASLIEAKELANELEVIIQEAKRKEDNPPAVAVETLYELLHDTHRIRRWRIGREAGLRTLDRPALLKFYRNYYRPSNTILAIVGDVAVDDVMRLVEATYGSLPDEPVERSIGPEERGRPGFRYREWSGDIALTQLVLGWRTPGTLHEDTPALDLLGMVLGTGRASRLYRAVRERQLASSISAHNYTPSQIGVFNIHAETSPQHTTAAAQAIWTQLAEIRDGGVGAHELERARRVTESRWIRRLESMEGQASHLAEWEALGGWRLGEQYLESLMSVTVDKVHEVARRYLTADRAGIVVYRPRSAPQVAGDAAAMRSLLDRSEAVVLLTPPPRQPAPIGERIAAPPVLESEIEGVRVYRSATGVPILVRPRRGAPVTHIGVFALGGASEEGPAHGGLTTLLARTATKGTERRSATQIAEDSELLGGGISASVGSEGFGWTISVPARHTDAALELLADVVQHATIPNDALETERTVALSDIAMLRDDMYRYPVRLATQAAFGAHPYGASSLGTEESLRAITLGDVRTWHRRRVLEAPLAIGIVGDFDPDTVAASVARAFPLLRPAEPASIPAPVWPTTPVVRAEQRDKAQTALALAFPGPSRRDPDRYAAHLIAGVASGLGGRFFEELRDRRSLAYTVHAYTSSRQLAGTFVAYIATSPANEEVARAGLLAEFAKLRSEPVTGEELRRAQEYAVGTHAIRQQSGGAVLGDIIDAWLHGPGLGELGEFEARVRSLTPRDLQAVAERYFDEGVRVEGIVRGR
jgi:zinc protease